MVKRSVSMFTSWSDKSINNPTGKKRQKQTGCVWWNYVTKPFYLTPYISQSASLKQYYIHVLYKDVWNSTEQKGQMITQCCKHNVQLQTRLVFIMIQCFSISVFGCTVIIISYRIWSDCTAILLSFIDEQSYYVKGCKSIPSQLFTHLEHVLNASHLLLFISYRRV